MRDAGLACGSNSRMLRDSCHSGGMPAGLANRLFQRSAGKNVTPYLNCCIQGNAETRYC